MITLESEVNFLFFLLPHFLSFEFSYPLSSAKVSLGCATLGRQINQWKISTAAVRNSNDKENFQMWIWL